MAIIIAGMFYGEMLLQPGHKQSDGRLGRVDSLIAGCPEICHFQPVRQSETQRPVIHKSSLKLLNSE